MKMRNLMIVGFLAATALSGCSAPSKILVANNFNSDDKTTKILILDSGQINPATKQKLFNVFVRMCAIDAQAKETACQDTKVAENVIPGSVY
jgi:hypothetical protein